MSKRSRRNSQPDEQSSTWDPFATLANTNGEQSQAADPYAAQQVPAFDPYAAPAAFDPYAAPSDQFDNLIAPYNSVSPSFEETIRPPANFSVMSAAELPAAPSYPEPAFAQPNFAPPEAPSFAPPEAPSFAAPDSPSFAAPDSPSFAPPEAPSFAPPGAPSFAAPEPAPSASPEPALYGGVALPPPPPLPPLPTAAPQSPVFGQPGSTRMREDSEVVAQARRAQPIAPPPPPLPIDNDAPPIVIPGASGLLPGIVPPPPVPTIEPAPNESPAYAFDDTGIQSSVSVPVANAPAPVSAARGPLVGGAAATVSLPDEQSDSWAPRRRQSLHDAPSELEYSAEVSAVVGVADAGAPRSALSSVSAQHHEAGIPHEDDDLDHTVIAVRKRPVWSLGLPLGIKLTLTSDYVILGRKPADEPAFPSAQLIPIADGTRTISKTHAVLALVDGSWTITDLGSTNGVVLIDDNGAEQEIAANTPAQVTKRFLLGDAELTIESSVE